MYVCDRQCHRGREGSVRDKRRHAQQGVAEATVSQGAHRLAIVRARDGVEVGYAPMRASGIGRS